MTNDLLKSMLEAQFGAAFAMFTDCIEKCPPEHWDALVAKYPFWLVAYHTLYCTDGYLAPSEDAFELHEDFHPGGWADINDEYPSRRFEKAELLAYAKFCREKAQAALAGETEDSLNGDSGFKRRNCSRAELYIYTLRHVQHHTGQLSAVLRREKIDPAWVGRGWGAV
jgi:uncharacterized damage-inducible protein DinB